ncbi:MAG: aminodeoxychorismate synthase component I [Caldiserica bacterium]|nr:aminodeoxychorismate synthase component I [Caldisericota bacterium]
MKKGIFAYPYSLNPLGLLSGLSSQPYTVFLHSSMYHPEWGRYTILGWEPFLIFKSKGRKVSLNGRVFSADPFETLKELWGKFYKPEESLPFTGGIIGYFSYDLGFLLERIEEKSHDDLGIPDMVLGFYKNFIVWDHKEKFAYGTLPGIKEEMSAEEKIITPSLPLKLSSNFTYKQYIQAIQKAKEYIRRGDIYQVNLSQRFSCPFSLNAFSYYSQLTRMNPSFYSAYLNFPEVRVVSSSPERFLYIEKDYIQTRPIKGTRPRGSTPEEDARLKKELSESEKDKAELVMIVDLERNDLGKICQSGSVRVKRLREIEAHPTVFHTVATVEGRVKDNLTPIDCLKACFPGGSITGAPKVRAMEIIEELEPTRRNIYTGSIGYIGFNGRADFSIVIRTVIIKDGQAYFQVGGGIVSDSNPEREYQETLDKGKALITTLRRMSHGKDMEKWRDLPGKRLGISAR